MAAIKRERINQIAIFLIALVCYAYFFPRWADPNQNSRLNMVVAIVDDGTFQIDKYVANTVDYAKVDGHYYSDKAPGVAFLGVPLYASLRAVLDLPVMGQLTERLGNSAAFKETLRESGSGVLEDKVRFALAQVVLSFLTNAVPTALLCVLIYRLLARFGSGQGSRIFVALAYGLLTPAFAYANSFYGHQLSAFLLFAAFYLLFPLDPSQNQSLVKPGAMRLFGIGLLLGYSVVTEFPAALIAGILTLYAFYVLYRVGALLKGAPMVAGLGICAAGLMLYNTTVFGGPFKLGYSNSELWTAQHSAGFMSLTMPGWEAASGITFSLFRGLFVLSPVLLLAVAGFVMWWRSGRLRAAFWVALLSTLSMFLFNASSIMWWGGFAIGPRYVLPGLPFMALAIVFVIDPATARQTQPATAQRPAAWLLGLVVVLSLWSFIATWGMTLAEQAFPSDAFRANPYIEHALPSWQAGNIARNLGTIAGFKGVTALMPLAALIVAVGAAWRLAGSWSARPSGSSRAFNSTHSTQADRLSEPARPVTDSNL
jgi:hypothetical protein